MPPLLGPLTLLDLAVVLGVAAVLPLALGGRVAWWLVAAASSGAALWQGAGSVIGVALAIPLLIVVIERGLRAAQRIAVPRTLADGGLLVAHGYAVVAATWLAISCGGWRPMGIREPIVQLTSIHFTYAGVGALVLAITAVSHAGTTRPARVAVVALLLTALAPPLVAVGFTTRAAAAQVGGAVLMTLGVWCTALTLLCLAARPATDWRARGLLVVSGLAVWVPMVLAVAWAAAQHWSVPALSIPDMARTHGMVNGLGFVIAGLVATVADRRGPSWS